MVRVSRASRGIGIASIVALCCLCLRSEPAIAGWQSENLDMYARFPSLAFDTSGKPAIAYFRDYDGINPSDKGLKYAHHDGTSWIITPVSRGGYSSSLAFDLSGDPAIAYKGDSGNLEYVHFNGASWHVTTFGEYIPSGNYKFISLAFDPSGNPGVGYITYHQGIDYVRYAYFSGNSWTTTTIETGFGTGSPALAFDASGRPAIAYIRGIYDSVINRWYFYLIYAYFNNTTWNTTIVDSGSKLRNAPISLAFDASGNPAISYSNGDVRYAHFNGTSWSITSVGMGDWNSLAFDVSGKPAIAYRTLEGYGCDWGCLSYAHFNGTSWETTPLGGGGGGYVSLAFNAGNPAIAHTRGSGFYLDYVYSISDTPPNSPPTAHAGSDQTVSEGALVTLEGAGSSDPEGAPMTYHWAQLAGPSVALDLTDPVHPTLIAPSVPAGGAAITFQLTVSDGTLTSDPDVVNITVKNVNHPPVADAGADQTVQEGSPVTLGDQASYDPDGEALTYSWAQAAGPPVALSNSATTQPSFTAPFVGSAGTMLTFQLTVHDGIDSATDTVNVFVENDNHPPTAHAGVDQTKDEGSVVTLNGLASNDPDEDPLIYNWTQLSGPVTTLSDPFSSAPSFTAPLVNTGGDTLIFQLTVSDDLGGGMSDEVAITILDINDPPACELAQANPALLWPPNHQLMPVDITGVSDPNNDQVIMTVTRVTQDEPINGLGDGDTSPDAVIQENSVLVRAERAGGGTGRVYKVTFSATDAAGGRCVGSVSICVPHDRRMATCVDDGQLYDSLQP
jgi:hypothetical protein